MVNSLDPIAGAVVVVTGASRGFGLASAMAMTARGARVVINGRDPDAVELAVAQTQQQGGQVLGVCADVATLGGARALLGATLRAFGRVDIWINNAGRAEPGPGPLWETPTADLRAILRTNLEGPSWCAQLVCRWARAHDARVWIVNVSSGAGERAIAGAAAYVASKHGLEGLTRALAADTRGTNITVTALKLPALGTRMTRQRMSAADHAALPPPASAVPALLTLLESRPAEAHGRSFAAWRLAATAQAELCLSSPLVALGAQGMWLDRRPSLDAGSQAVRLERLESAFGPAVSVRQALADFAQQGALQYYPDEHQTALRDVLTRAFSCDPRQVSLAPGSSELVERVLRLFVRPGEAVACHDPTWFMFDRMCAALGVEQLRAPLRPDFATGTVDFNIAGILDAVARGARLVYLVNPSNPLGAVIPEPDLTELLRRIPGHIPVVIDEAYAEFASPGASVFAPRIFDLARGKRLIVLRTFSKFHGLAGLRVGYALTSTQHLGAMLAALEMPYNVATASAVAARAAALDPVENAQRLQRVTSERERWARRLRERDLRFLASGSCFHLVKLPVDPGPFLDAIETQQIFLPRAVYFEDCVLLPVARREQNDRIWQAVSARIP